MVQQHPGDMGQLMPATCATSRVCARCSSHEALACGHPPSCCHAEPHLQKCHQDGQNLQGTKEVCQYPCAAPSELHHSLQQQQRWLLVVLATWTRWQCHPTLLVLSSEPCSWSIPLWCWRTAGEGASSLTRTTTPHPPASCSSKKPKYKDFSTNQVM